MTNTVNRIRLGVISALAAGILVAIIGLFGSGGPPPVSAQTETGICDRTEPVQDAILGWLVVDDCADVTDSHLAGITLGLRISNGPNDRQALSLESGDFAGLVNIEQLVIYNHTMDALPEDIFNGLGSLELLHLSNNEIAALPEDVFDGLGSLESLDLGVNQIGTLPEDVFDGLGSLESLDLGVNQIGTLPEDVFDGLGSLESLDLGVNQIGTLPEDVFDGLGSLESLELYGNRINALPEDVFAGLGNLKYLRLSFNQLSVLPDDVFDDLGNLVHLDVQENQLSALTEDVFNGLGSLERLDLSYNEIAALPEDVFDGLGNLKSLRVDSNNLASPPEDVFDGLDSLTHLTLSTNRIHTLPEDVFEGLGNLTYLSLAGNPGTPFTLTAYLERQGDNAVLVKVAEGVPFDMAVTLSATGGTLSAASVTIEGGTAGSEAVTATRSSDGPVTVSVASAVFQAGSYLGIQTGLGEPLILGGDAVGGNHPATGAPAISGAVQVGETLTADTSGIADEDGLDNVSYSYQWLSSRDTEIDGATGSTYTLQARDLGKIIKVRVTFTDDAGNEETLTSAATDAVEARPNIPATGAPTISGTAQVGETLTADASGIADKDGLTNATFAYQWLADSADITGATGVTYIPVAADEGKAMNVRVTFTDDAGSEEELTSAVTASVAAKANTPATGAPTISGTAQVGGTLTADTSGISDTDGLDNATYSYQWLTSRDAEISGATNDSYTLVSADEDKTIKVRVTFTDDAGYEESLTSAATTAVAATVPGAPGSLSVSVNDTGKLDVSWSAPGGTGGTAVSGYRVQWKESDDSWDTPADVSETTVTGTSHTVTGLTDGVEYTFRVFAVNRVGDSAASEEESGAPKETTVPTVSSAVADEAFLLLTFSEGLSQTSFPAKTTFTVNVGDNQLGVDSLAISGSTVTLTLASAVTSTDAVSVSYTVPSDAAAARLNDLSDNSVASFTGQPVTNNTAAAQTPLTASIHDDATSHDGQAEFTFELRFSENLEGFSYRTLRDHAFTVTNGEVKVARRLVRGSNIRWEIKVRPTSNSDVTIVLPITTDCTVSGGVCTGDGRKLSNRLELAVSGPTSQQSQENTPATGTPTISGAVQVGQTLTASTLGIADTDGLTNASYSHQWIGNDGTSDSDIAGASASTYTLVDEDAGKTIKVRVTFTDDGGNDETLTSAPTGAVAPKPNTQATGTPTINGTAQVGETLTTDTSGIEDDDGLDAVTFNFQWLAGNAHIGGATRSSYTTAEADEGLVIQVRVTFTDNAGNDEMLTSTATAAVTPKPNTPATGQPSITGTAEVGETLTADTSRIEDDDGLDAVTFNFQWLAGGTDIRGATRSSHTIAEADEGLVIQVRVSFTDDTGNDEILTSVATAAVTPKPNTPATGQPSIRGTAQVGETLTAETSDMSDTDGLDDASFAYQWLAGGADIHGATGSTYTLTEDEEGLIIQVRLTFTDDAGHSETLTSEGTESVASSEPESPVEPPPAPQNLVGTVNSDGSVTLTWEAPDDDSITGYQILRRRPTEGENTLLVYVADTQITATTYTDTNVTTGVQHAYRVKAINAAGPGSVSNFVNLTP